MKKKQGFFYLVMALWIVLDQISKYTLMEKDRVLIPGIVHLTTAYNEGVAMSMFSGAGVLLPIITSVIILGGIVLVHRYAKGWLPLLSCGMILGGAVGNLIDRCLLGYVIDLFEFVFVDFYIFNVADIGITVGAVLCGISLVFFEKRDWRTKENP